MFTVNRQPTVKVTVVSALPSYRHRPYVNGRDGDGVQQWRFETRTSTAITLVSNESTPMPPKLICTFDRTHSIEPKIQKEK